MKHRIKALHISDPLIFDQIFPTPEDIVSYSQLQAIFFDKIESKLLESLLKHSAILLKLSSLSIHLDKNTYSTNIFILILNLPMLKYCKLLFEGHYTRVSLPTSTNISSPIEYLIIDAQFYLEEINILLSYFPKLRRLSIKTYSPKVLVLILLKNSTRLSFALDDLKNNRVEEFIKEHHDQIKLFHFSVVHGYLFDTIERLKKTILSYLPYSKVFYFHHPRDILCDYILEIYNTYFIRDGRYMSGTKQWFFTHESMSDEELHNIFCSFQPHR